jgi:lipopolysaccharide transport system permease protein
VSLGQQPASALRLAHWRDLLLELVRRDMKLRYQRSVLGLAWSLLNPLAQLLVFSFVFQQIVPLNIPNYAAFLFTGLLAWNWLSTSLNAGAGAIVDHRDLVKRPGFPLSVLPVVIVTTQALHYLLALPALLGYLVWIGLYPGAAALLLPLVFAVQFLFLLGVVFFLASMHVTFRDTQYLLGIALMLGFYLSPVLYQTGQVPGRFQWVYQINPAAVLLDAYRAVLLDGRPPNWIALSLLALVSLALIAVGRGLFMRSSGSFVEEL